MPASPLPPLPAALTAPNAVALRLGHAGLAPFVLGAALLWILHGYPEPHAFVAMAMSAYAAIIVSFLGGIHWGLGMRHADPAPSRFGWGVASSLFAWIAAVMPAYAGLVLHGVMLVLCYLVDRHAYPAHGIGAWLTLRFRLTAVASLACFIGAAVS